MKKYKVFILFACFVLTNDHLYSQSAWTSINSPRGNFRFSFPQYASPVDTLSFLSYFTNTDDSTIAFQVNFIEGVYISGNDELQQYLAQSSGSQALSSDPCYVDSIQQVLSIYAQMYQQTTQGTIEGFETRDYQPCFIRGKELTIRHPDISGGPGYYFMFTRYYYWNQKFLAFTVTGPEEKLSQLYAYKNQFFDSITIY